MADGYTAVVSFTPAAAAYLAGDVMDVAKEVVWQDWQGNAPPQGSSLIITTARLEVYASAIISGETSYRMHLYGVTPPSAHADNDAWDLPSGDRSEYKGYIDLGSPVDFGSTLVVETNGINKQTKLDGAKSSNFAELVTNGGFTATAAARKITLHGVLV